MQTLPYRWRRRRFFGSTDSGVDRASFLDSGAVDPAADGPLNLNVVAEGVEDPEQLVLLQKLRGDHFCSAQRYKWTDLQRCRIVPTRAPSVISKDVVYTFLTQSRLMVMARREES